MANPQLSTPTPCSDDVQMVDPASDFQTGREVNPASSSLDSTNIQQDAERVHQNPSGATIRIGGGRCDGAAKTTDVIEISDRHESYKIRATGLVAAAQSGGGFVQVGGINHLTIHKGSKDGGDSAKPKNIRNKLPITTNQSEPDFKHLDTVAAGLAGEWRRLGRHLALSESSIDQTHMNYHVEGQHEVNYRILLMWKQQSTHPTVQKLAQALVDIGRGDLADALARS